MDHDFVLQNSKDMLTVCKQNHQLASVGLRLQLACCHLYHVSRCCMQSMLDMLDRLELTKGMVATVLLG